MLESDTSNARFHAVTEEQVTFRTIAGVIGARLNLPVMAMPADEAADHFGWFAGFAGADGPASSLLTQQRLGWRPVQPGLVADLHQSTSYFQS